GKAADDRKGHGSTEKRVGTAPAGTGTAPSEGVRRTETTYHRRQRSNEGLAPTTRANGCNQRARPDLWRERRGQGTGGPCDPRVQRAVGRAVHCRQLRRDTGRPDRE